MCSDIGPSDTQGLALAAGLHGKTLKDVPSQQRNKDPERKRVVLLGAASGAVLCGIGSSSVTRGK